MGYTSQQAWSICMKHHCCLHQLLQVQGYLKRRQQHPWVAKFPVSRGRRGMEKREVTLFCSHIAQTTVRELQQPGRGGPCTVRHRSGMVIIPLQAKSKSRCLWLSCWLLSLSLDTAMPRASGKATWWPQLCQPVCPLFSWDLHTGKEPHQMMFSTDLLVLCLSAW